MNRDSHSLAAPGLTVRDVVAVAELIEARRGMARGGALLVAISGIDGSGKGYFASRLAKCVQARGLKAAVLNVDAWLRLPSERFDAANPAEHFYHRALRLDEMFQRLVLPLQRDRRVAVEADVASTESQATSYRRERFEFRDVDVILLEGIFLFKAQYRSLYDLAIWMDCSFETALRRAIRRNQEGLPLDEMLREYDTIYFPAQRLHFEIDSPRAGADLIVDNDAQDEAHVR